MDETALPSSTAKAESGRSLAASPRRIPAPKRADKDDCVDRKPRGGARWWRLDDLSAGTMVANAGSFNPYGQPPQGGFGGPPPGPPPGGGHTVPQHRLAMAHRWVACPAVRHRWLRLAVAVPSDHPQYDHGDRRRLERCSSTFRSARWRAAWASPARLRPHARDARVPPLSLHARTRRFKLEHG